MMQYKQIKSVKVIRQDTREQITVKVGRKYVHGGIGVIEITNIEMHSPTWKRITAITNTGKRWCLEQRGDMRFRTRILFEVK